LQEKYSRFLLLAIPLAVAGLFLIIGFDERQIQEKYVLGIYYGLATAVLYASYILSLKQLSSRCRETYQPMLLASFFTAAVLGLAIFFTDTSFVIPNVTSFFSLLSLGFFSQCLGWLLIASSLPKTDTSRAGLILLLQPALSFVWDVVFFQRPTALVNWVGVVVTLSAIYIGLRSKRQALTANR
ncbi:MAG TPA: DMT family transporter, partial [Desulfopila sp.]|nr:DMT family transporter [Desulfopila sp.]